MKNATKFTSSMIAEAKDTKIGNTSDDEFDPVEASSILVTSCTCKERETKLEEHTNPKPPEKCNSQQDT